MSKSIYKSQAGEKLVKDLYDRQLQSLGVSYEDFYVETRFGKTHVLKMGNAQGKPVIFFHGGNSTAPYALKNKIHFLKKYQVFAPDTIGHPGKSDQTVLSPYTLEYGRWAGDVIDSLGLDKAICIGESFGGGILAKLMCVSSEKIAQAVLIVPAGICNAGSSKIIFSMGIPMAMYMMTKDEKWLKKAIMPMALDKNCIDRDTIEMVRIVFQHVSVKSGMPSDVKEEDIKNCEAPILLFAAEKDILFPGKQVIERAEEIIPHLDAHLLKNCGHMYFCSEEINQYIKNKINEFI